MAASLTTLSFVPQVVRAVRTRDVTGISIPMYVAFCTGVALWIAFGVATVLGGVVNLTYVHHLSRE